MGSLLHWLLSIACSVIPIGIMVLALGITWLVDRKSRRHTAALLVCIPAAMFICTLRVWHSEYPAGGPLATNLLIAHTIGLALGGIAFAAWRRYSTLRARRRDLAAANTLCGIYSPKAWWSLHIAGSFALLALVWLIQHSPTPSPAAPRQLPTMQNSLGMVLVQAPAGTFTMGAPSGESDPGIIYRFEQGTPPYDEHEHRVRIPKPFWIGRYEVTRGQFAAFVNETGYTPESIRINDGCVQTGGSTTRTRGIHWLNPGFPQNDDHPAVCMTVKDADAFCKWLSAKEGRPYRLPTEPEWEYACRAGSRTTYPWAQPDLGNRFAHLGPQANVAFFSPTDPVGSYQPNLWGIYDMQGGVREICSDTYGPYPGATTFRPTAGNQVGNRCVRGAWSGAPVNYARSARRSSTRLDPDITSSTLGFRIAMDSLEAH